jgi:lactoylglutathione lyase
MTEQTKTRITGVRTVGVPVTDQDRALTFYVQTLAFEKRLDAPVEQLGGRWIEVAPAGAAITIARVPAPRAAGRRRDRHRQIRREVARS